MIQALVVPKPEPTDAIVTDQKAADLYSAEVEGWGDDRFDAGGVVCRYAKKVWRLKVHCPDAPQSRSPGQQPPIGGF